MRTGIGVNRFVRTDGTVQCRFVRIVDHTPKHWRVEHCDGSEGIDHEHATSWGGIKSGVWVDGDSLKVQP